jgi:acetylglutamate/LysW-gamma-L-alpha-aminoadipate kinase
MMLVKIGGSVFDNIEEILNDIPKKDVVIVHGGAKQVTRIAEKMGKEQRFVMSPSGYRSRYTDEQDIEIFQMVVTGRVNKDIVRMLEKGGTRAIGLCGIDLGLIRAERKKHLICVEGGKKKVVKGGYTGKITRIRKEVLEDFMAKGIVPVIAALALGKEYESLNVNADRLAARLSQCMDFEEIVFFTDRDGILDRNNKTIHRIGKTELNEINAGPGMREKLQACSQCRAERITILNGLKNKPFSEMRGTVIECNY